MQDKHQLSRHNHRPDVESTARWMDDFVTRWLAEYRDKGKSVHCRSGCGGCCSMAVHTTFPEACAIAGVISDKAAEQLDGYLEKLLSRRSQYKDLGSYLRLHRREIGPCPFLDQQQSCTIYPHRPLSCRALLSTRPAEWCRVDFAEMDPWDRQVYTGGLDPQVVAWPTHYVAATQDFARELECRLQDHAIGKAGWSLSGNLGLMIWLARKYQLAPQAAISASQVQRRLDEHDLNLPFVIQLLTASGAE